MNSLHLLIVEDHKAFHSLLRQTLRGVSGEVKVSSAFSYSEAAEHIRESPFDLITVDLRIPENPGGYDDSEQHGLLLMREIRSSRLNQHCGLVVLTGQGTPANTRQSLLEYNADDFVDKDLFDNFAFIRTAKSAIFRGRLRFAEDAARSRYRVKIRYDEGGLISSELSGPDRRGFKPLSGSPKIDVADLSRRADNLDRLISQGGPEVWRPEARSIGNAIYKSVGEAHGVAGDIAAARALAERSSDIWLEFSGPAIGLGLPFELLRDQDECLALSHILTRHVVTDGGRLEHKTEAFHDFLAKTYKDRDVLHVLVVGADSDRTIPGAEQEAEALATAIGADLNQIGLSHDITLISGKKAQFAQIIRELQSGRYHIFHYAGHGMFDQKLPESSGLVLRDGRRLRTLTASDLALLVQGSNLRLVFLSCCLGSRIEVQSGRSDFHGVMDALVRADVPIAISYRWSVSDSSARTLALLFYQALWRTFSPGESLLQARRSIAMGPRGRDDETWASAVLMMQSP